MQTTTPVTIKRSDYQSPNWLVHRTNLYFDLHPSATRVTSELSLSKSGDGPLVLAGAELELESMQLDGNDLPSSAWHIEGERMFIDDLPDECRLTIVTRMDPDSNTALEGLYRSSGLFCTQCEAEGFRKITWYPDRPDVLSIFDVTIAADADECPVLLSNGNFVGSQMLENGRHVARWHDPHPKPCYLFALVAGDLAHIEESYTTASGRQVRLFVYVQAHNIDKCGFALESLQRAMRWDERVYGLEYDLERFMIVAVDDFNMGAMENKGLNIFNSKYVLADERAATDADFIGVESVIAHEYFHNWTGNRVTLRDWFQLSLKEGLTVFRDQEFTADQRDRAVKRIEDVRLLRAAQFPEDSGPMAHPVRPDSYIEINNFYTLTVYEKGAEVIRMLHTLIGAEAFRRGMELYFERYDGSAVTCDDFVDAMHSASGKDLSRFSLWYSIAGTPELSISGSYDEQNRRYTLDVTQSCADTPGQSNKPPLHIPLRIGLLAPDGAALPLTCGRVSGDSSVIDITRRRETFVFDHVDVEPVPSLLRGFSAPVRLHYEASDATLAFLMAHDADSYNRWEAGQRLAERTIARQLARRESGADDRPTNPQLIDEAFVAAFGAVLEAPDLSLALKAEALMLPSISTLADAQAVIDISAIDAARRAVLVAVASHHREALIELVCHVRSPELALLDPQAMAERSLANTALSLLSALDADTWLPLAAEQYRSASNMTDRVTALATLCHQPGTERDAALEDFYNMWQHERLVIDKWFAVQAMAHHSGATDEVIALTRHPAFDTANPNRLRSLIGAFASGNPVQFHAEDGRGYELLERHVIELDRRNPQIAARLVTPLIRWRRHKPDSGQLMRASLERIAAVEKLSPDVYEIVHRSLSD